MKLFGSDAANVLSAMSHSLAIIEFDPAGSVLAANGNFCAAIGSRHLTTRCATA